MSTPTRSLLRDTEDASFEDIYCISARARACHKDAALERLTIAAPILVRAIQHGSDQGVKVRSIVWSAWNGAHFVGLYDVLSGLDSDLIDAVLALLYARAHLAGDADDLIRQILHESGEFARWEQAVDNTPAGLEVVYPEPQHSLRSLRAVVTTLEALHHEARADGAHS